MKLKHLGQFGIALLSAVCMLAAVASTAFGAGTPILTGSNFEGPGTLNSRTSSVTVNPNGAATTVTLQYRKATASSEWQTTNVQAIGSEGPVTVSGTAFPLKMWTYYEYRATATNSYGTMLAESANATENNWALQKGYGTTSKLNTEGTFKVTWTAGRSITCTEYGYGEFGELNESYHLTASSCKYEISGTVVCSPAPISIELDRALQTTEKEFEFCPHEEGGVVHRLRFPNGIQVSEPALGSEKRVSEPVTLTAAAKVDNANATMTISSHWSLTGSNTGLKFGPSSNAK